MLDEEACKRERAKAADATAAKAEAVAEAHEALQDRMALEQELAECRAAVAERDEHASRLAARMQIALSKTHIRGVRAHGGGVLPVRMRKHSSRRVCV